MHLQTDSPVEAVAMAAQASAHALKGMLSTFENSQAVNGLRIIEVAAGSDDILAARHHLQPYSSEIQELIDRILNLA